MASRIAGMAKIYLRTRWGLLFQLSVGSFMFSFIFASVPIFHETAQYASHKFELERNSAEALSIQALLPNRPLEGQWYSEADRIVRDSAGATIAPFISRLQAYGNIQSAYIVASDQELQVTPSSPQALLQFAEGLEEYVQIVDGIWPVPEGVDTGGIPLAIGSRAAALLSLEVGSRVRVIPDPNNLRRQFSGVISAVVEVRDESDIYWMGYDRLSPYPVGSGMRSYMVIPVTLRMNDFLGYVGSQLAPITANYWWYGAIDKAVLETLGSHVPPQEAKKFESRLNQRYPRGSIFSSLDLLDKAAIARDDAVRLALHVGVAALVAFSAVYFLVLGNTFSVSEFRDYRKLFDRGMPWKRVLVPSITVGVAIFPLSLGLGISAALSVVPRFLDWRFTEALSMDIADLDVLGPVVIWSMLGIGVGIILFVLPFVLRALETGPGQNKPTKRAVPIYACLGITIAGVALILHGANSGTERSGNFLASNIALIVAPTMILIGTSGMCAQLVEFLADIVRIRLGSRIPQRVFIVLAMLKASARSTIPLLMLATLAIMVLTVNAGLASSIGIAWDMGIQGGTSMVVVSDPVIETILYAFGIGCCSVIVIVSTFGVVTVTANAMKERRRFVGVVNALGYAIESAWRLAFFETIIPIALCMGAGFVIAQELSQRLSPLLWTSETNSFVTVIPDSGIPLQMILGVMGTIEIGLIVAFFLVRKSVPRVSAVAEFPEGITGV